MTCWGLESIKYTFSGTYYYYIITAGDRSALGLPRLSNKHLQLIQWIPDGGTAEKRQIRIAETLASKWREIGIRIGLDDSQITNIENPGSGKPPIQCLYEAFRMWQDSLTGDEQSEYSYSWDGLLELLKDVEQSILAEDLKEAMTSQRNSIQGNLRPNSKRKGTTICT